MASPETFDLVLKVEINNNDNIRLHIHLCFRSSSDVVLITMSFRSSRKLPMSFPYSKRVIANRLSTIAQSALLTAWRPDKVLSEKQAGISGARTA